MARILRQQYTTTVDGQKATRVASKWYIEYVDGQGVRRRVPGFKDKKATQNLASELERQAERQRAGIVDQRSIDVSEHMGRPIREHVEAYQLSLDGASSWHISETIRRLGRLIKDCQFARLRDIQAEPVQQWCRHRESEGMSPRTRNTHTGSLRAFVRWAIQDGRLSADPLETLGKAAEQEDVRRRRRALSEDELIRLLEAAERRPLEDAMMIRRGKRKGQLAAKVNDDRRRELIRLGRERALIYKTLILTGLRRNELATLTWNDLSLDDGPAWLTLRPENEKSRKGESVAIRADLAEELRQWRIEKSASLPGAAVFMVPKQLVRILDRDLVLAGISKVDDQGLVIDVHAFRHTTATYMAKAGVAARTAQAHMRHSDVRLTLGAYTDPRLLDHGEALEALPQLDQRKHPDRQRATGTCDSKTSLPTGLPTLLPKRGTSAGKSGASPCTGAARSEPKAGRRGGNITPTQDVGCGTSVRLPASECTGESNSGRTDSNRQHSAWKADDTPCKC